MIFQKCAPDIIPHVMGTISIKKITFIVMWSTRHIGDTAFLQLVTILSFTS